VRKSTTREQWGGEEREGRIAGPRVSEDDSGPGRRLAEKTFEDNSEKNSGNTTANTADEPSYITLQTDCESDEPADQEPPEGEPTKIVFHFVPYPLMIRSTMTPIAAATMPPTTPERNHSSPFRLTIAPTIQPMRIPIFMSCVIRGSVP